MPTQFRPPWLAIVLWHCGRVTRSCLDGSLEDPDRAFTEAVERGDNPVRIDAMLLRFFALGITIRADRLDIAAAGDSADGRVCRCWS
jgi:hypothetical protein